MPQKTGGLKQLIYNKAYIQKIPTNIKPEASSGDRLIGIDGKATLYNGRTGEPYDNEVTLGYVYILKLAHKMIR